MIMERKQDSLKSFGKRCNADTPPFFRKLRLAGMIVAAVGATIVAAPIALPAIVGTIGGYLILGGTVATAVSQAAVSEEDCEK
jgi:hypothetical protein